MKEMMPYIVSITTSLIAAISSIMISKREIKGEIEKLVKQHELEMEREREKYNFELEKLKQEHHYQMELEQREFDNKLGADVLNTLVTEAMKMPEVKQQISKKISSSKRK